MAQSSNEFYTQYQDILPPNALGYRLKLLSQLIERRFQEILDPYGLTPLQWGVLCCLWLEDGLPTLQISKQLQQLSGNLTVALPLMEKQGYIQRQCDQQDRRVLRVWLTPKGKQLQKVLPKQAQDLDKQLFESLSEDERVNFSEIVNRLRADLESSHQSITERLDQA
jgi:DNA-binding MarR family transcriptional regulator